MARIRFLVTVARVAVSEPKQTALDLSATRMPRLGSHTLVDRLDCARADRI